MQPISRKLPAPGILYGTIPAMLNRLKRDPFFFGLLLIFLWFAGFSLAITYYLFRDRLSLVATVGSFVVACLLFRWRQT